VGPEANNVEAVGGTSNWIVVFVTKVGSSASCKAGSWTWELLDSPNLVIVVVALVTISARECAMVVYITSSSSSSSATIEATIYLVVLFVVIKTFKCLAKPGIS